MVCGVLKDTSHCQGPAMWPLLHHPPHVPSGDALHGLRRGFKDVLRQTDSLCNNQSYGYPVCGADGDGATLHHYYCSTQVR